MQNTCFLLNIHLSLQKATTTYVQLHQPKRWLEEAEAQVSKINSKRLDLFLAEYMRMIFKGWPHRKKVASPGQPSTDRTWRDKFKNFVSTRAQNAKHMFFAENTFVLAKGYNHICSASPTKKGDLKRPRRRCQKLIPRGWNFFGWIHADDLQRLAPQEKKVASPGQPSTDRTWWDKFKHFVSTRAQNAKHMFFCWTYIYPRKSLQPHMFSFTNQKGDLKRPRRRCQKLIPRGWTFFRLNTCGWSSKVGPTGKKSRITRPTIHR